jgi:hypothetical protein
MTTSPTVSTAGRYRLPLASEHNQIGRTAIGQIGRGNVLAISGGRYQFWSVEEDGEVIAVLIELPVAYGYRVEVEYSYGSDTYTVRRVFKRGATLFLKGEMTDVHCEELGEAAYKASCYLDPWG